MNAHLFTRGTAPDGTFSAGASAGCIEPRLGFSINSRGSATQEPTPGFPGYEALPRRGSPFSSGYFTAPRLWVNPSGVPGVWRAEFRGLKPPAIHGTPLRGGASHTTSPMKHLVLCIHGVGKRTARQHPCICMAGNALARSAQRVCTANDADVRQYLFKCTDIAAYQQYTSCKCIGNNAVLHKYSRKRTSYNAAPRRPLHESSAIHAAFPRA
jgi:hypothetical protein